ncbi:hypothetical protein [Variovorax sp. KK3]|uniref:hypothetical protein n=1 Tax=Variovorax sp. KK3 TaxID=1855728 RepID=UPI00097BAFF3|nr:hypothetical protein [Variovorax sp. KK3]
MAQIPMVTAVRFDQYGDVSHVLMGRADTDSNRWITEPAETPVAELVKKLAASVEVATSMPDGTLGPKLRVMQAKAGGNTETVSTDDPGRPIDDFLQF